MSKRVLFFLDELYFKTNTVFGSSSVAGEFLRQLSCPIEKSFMFPVANLSVKVPKTFSTKLNPELHRIYGLPFWDSLLGYVKAMLCLQNLSLFFGSIHRAVDENDLFWIREPSLPGIFLAERALRKGKLVFIHMAGDIRNAWNNPKYKGGGKFFGFLIAQFIQLELLKLQRNRNCQFFCTGNALLNLFSKKNQEKKPVFFIDSMVGNNSLEAHAPDPAVLRLLYVGRLEKDKGIFVLLDAVKQLVQENAPISLDIVGFGSEEECVKRFINDNGLQANIQFLGYYPNENIIEVYRKNDVFICPSFNEGFPRVIIEAWGCGLAVISTRVGGIEGLGVDKENIYFCKKESVESLRAAILVFVKNRNQLSLAMQKVRGTWGKITREYFLELLSVCIQKRLQGC
ncbi:MAG: glycosyltransferase family 4 protein [Candidatus Ozemobacteraceae bacterium]